MKKVDNIKDSKIIGTKSKYNKNVFLVCLAGEIIVTLLLIFKYMGSKIDGYFYIYTACLILLLPIIIYGLTIDKSLPENIIFYDSNSRELSVYAVEGTKVKCVKFHPSEIDRIYQKNNLRDKYRLRSGSLIITLKDKKIVVKNLKDVDEVRFRLEDLKKQTEEF